MDINKIIIGNNVLEEDNSCIISFSKRANIYKIIMQIIIFIILVFLYFYLSSKKKSQVLDWVMIVGLIFFIITICIGIKNCIKLPKPIILSGTGVRLPDGKILKWKDIESIYFHPIRGNMPEFHIKTKHSLEAEVIIDWYLYANKKELIRLFEKYSQKKLYN